MSTFLGLIVALTASFTLSSLHASELTSLWFQSSNGLQAEQIRLSNSVDASEMSDSEKAIKLCSERLTIDVLKAVTDGLPLRKMKHLVDTQVNIQSSDVAVSYQLQTESGDLAIVLDLTGFYSPETNTYDCMYKTSMISQLSLDGPMENKSNRISVQNIGEIRKGSLQGPTLLNLYIR